MKFQTTFRDRRLNDFRKFRNEKNLKQLYEVLVVLVGFFKTQSGSKSNQTLHV